MVPCQATLARFLSPARWDSVRSDEFPRLLPSYLIGKEEGDTVTIRLEERLDA